MSFLVADGDLYTGTVADFSGMDPIIYRESLQTEQYDSMSLNGEYCNRSMLMTVACDAVGTCR
jgi:semaphorin 6